jgi:hypothetical protein
MKSLGFPIHVGKPAHIGNLQFTCTARSWRQRHPPCGALPRAAAEPQVPAAHGPPRAALTFRLAAACTSNPPSHPYPALSPHPSARSYIHPYSVLPSKRDKLAENAQAFTWVGLRQLQHNIILHVFGREAACPETPCLLGRGAGLSYCAAAANPFWLAPSQ